ncbi:hypothetical protein M0R72_15050 [Candidatus Pacearchaeota archaeon]|jgi:HK97 gp10 family phage protein|nr:hypothetical protein [Candidatus Pacearchaeota archaeon]
MGWSSNLSVVLASLESKRRKIDQAVENTANKGKVIGVQEIQARLYAGHGFDTGNLSGSYPRCTTIAKPADGVRQIDFTSDVDYQIFVEKGTSRMSAKPHLEPGVNAAIPRISKILKEEMEKG